jgi:replicative DNA helicase
MRTIAEQMNKIKEDPNYAEKLLYPGRRLSEFDGNSLKIEVIPSGFPSLDGYKLLKRNRGELIIIGARPSQGKSGLGFQIATQVAEVGKSHIFSLEMDHESIVARQASISLKKPLDYVQRYGIPPAEINRVKALLERINCIVDDTSSLNVHQICDRARNEYKRSKTDVIVIDYLQIVNCDWKSNRAVELGTITQTLKNLAKELRVPIIALSQLNRNSEYREDGTPQLADLKESGSLEQDADVVLLIHRSKDSPTTAKIIVAKNRNGPTGEVEMTFAPGQAKFVDSNPLDNDVLG